MTFSRDDLTTYEPLVTTLCISSAYGVSSFDGTKVTLTGVLHVPNLARRLISVPSLTDKGVTVVFRHKVCEISFRGEKLMEVARMGKLYATVTETANEVHDSRELMNAKEEHETELWHSRLGSVATDSEMMEVDEDARDNMEVDEECYDSVPTVREHIPNNNDLNLLPVATVNTVQQPIREQLPVARRPQLPPRPSSSN
ncbi:hypothetical protein PsorP6_006246 [Peronosclerospora sorghi]|uniref:Uncharacterized protein n=1 Tax=Peronosclerospora sorghi TaxID=230839 RepID=A0ACC0W3S9_9STRA|nr:hypothetical protein PsorP6_006246 [Peronosclerospora sorghi]